MHSANPIFPLILPVRFVSLGIHIHNCLMAKLHITDFEIDEGTPLGCGALAMVNRCRHTPSQRHFAVKVLSKLQLLQLRRVEAVMGEKEALYALGPHAGIVYLHGTAQTEDELYFVLDLLPNGDLLEHIRRVAGKRRLAGEDQSTVSPTPCLSFHDTRIITAQLVTVLAHVFAKGYILRDLKPENVAFDADGRCVLIDFDTAVKNSELPVSNMGIPLAKDRPKPAGDFNDALPEARPIRKVSEIQAMRRNTSAFCGTAHYVAPESLGECKYTFASDLFALGGVVYHMLAGKPVFSGASSFFVMKDIKDGVARKTMPPAVCRHPGAEEFIRGLLHTDPVKRLGVDPETRQFDVERLRSHPFFNGFDWDSAAYPPAAARVPLEPVPLAQRNATPAPRYDDAPFHTDEYAAYVFHAGDSAFERFATGEAADVPVRTAEEATAGGEADDREPDEASDANAGESANGVGSATASGGAGGGDDDDDVVSIEDDVGLCRAGDGEEVEWRGGFQPV
jgi:serine/threonine protein kinase